MTFPELKKKYIDTGKVRYIFLVRNSLARPARRGHFMSRRCAGDNYFPMVDVLFKQQQNWGGGRKRQGR